MPELPDIENYVRALRPRTIGSRLQRVRVGTPFILRTFTTPVSALEQRSVVGVQRSGKRIAFALDDGYFLVLHLMIAGRLHWRPPGARMSGKSCVATVDFEGGSLHLTEASSKKRAAIYSVSGDEAQQLLDTAAVEPLDVSEEEFATVLRCENHTVKRSLTDPRIFSGIGNAYSDEILHRARLSPVKWTSRLTDDEISRLYEATRDVLTEWVERLANETGTGFPDKVTAFRPEMAVHGKYGQPCPVCGAPVQRIEYADRESNYCAVCQNDGKLLADRGLSRLLKSDWPRTLEEMEERKAHDRAVIHSARPRAAEPEY